MRELRIGLLVMTCSVAGCTPWYRDYRDATIGEVIEQVQEHTNRIIVVDRDVSQMRISVTFWNNYGANQADDFVLRVLPMNVPVTVEVTSHTLHIQCIRTTWCEALARDPGRRW